MTVLARIARQREGRPFCSVKLYPLPAMFGLP